MDHGVSIPGPAGKDYMDVRNPEEKIAGKPIIGHRAQGAHPKSLSDFHNSGLVYNITVEVLKVTPSIFEETCLLLRDENEVLQAFMTKSATSKHGRPKPGDKLIIEKASVIVSRHHIPIKLICLDHNSIPQKSEGNIRGSRGPMRPLDQVSISEHDNYLFSESDEDFDKPVTGILTNPSTFESEEKAVVLVEKDDLLDGLDDPF